MSEEIDCFVPNERPDRNTRAAPRRWSDDPWCNMTTGEADAYRRGWEDAKREAIKRVRDAGSELRSEALLNRTLYAAFGRTVGAVVVAITTMDPPA